MFGWNGGLESDTVGLGNDIAYAMFDKVQTLFLLECGARSLALPTSPALPFLPIPP